jgi:hypothetical protein
MNDKERLEMIKHDFEVREGFIEEYDVQWLIEQAENAEKLNKRVGELLLECRHLQKRGDDAIMESGKLWTKIFHAKEALK